MTDAEQKKPETPTPKEPLERIVVTEHSRMIGGKKIEAKPGAVLYVPANTIHAGKASPDGDVVFFTCKDASHSLHGIKAT